MSNALNAYLQVREKEGRLYLDQVVAQLPKVPRTHPLHDEWRARSFSAKRLCDYLRSRWQGRATTQSILPTVLELGCGNGWLTNYIAVNTHSYVWGVDRNQFELVQAARVFGGNWQLGFAHADIFNAPFANNQFDVIVLASAIQYFPDLGMLIKRLLSLLNPGGELHIMDSRLYTAQTVEMARTRSAAYYTSLGAPEMAGFYHHHTYDDVVPFSPDVLYSPDTPWIRLKRRVGLAHSPFVWLRFRP